MHKDYTALLSAKVWPKVEGKLLANVKNPGIRNNLKVVLANTRQALLADTTMQNMVYLNNQGIILEKSKTANWVNCWNPLSQ